MTTNNRPRPKTELLYWTERISFQTAASRTYSVQIQYDKRRENHQPTDSKQGRSRDSCPQSLSGIACLRLGRNPAPPQGRPAIEKKVRVTIGEYLGAVREKSLIHPKTLKATALPCARSRAISAASIAEAASAQTGVHKSTLSSLPRSRLLKSKNGAPNSSSAAINPLKEKSARISADSFIGRARSLFGSEVIAQVKDIIKLPDPIPFAGVKVERVRATRYRSTFDMAMLLESARQELAIEKAEQFKIFLLGAMAGLRRREIDLLPWSAFRWNEGVLRIEATEFFRPKTHESASDIAVDSDLPEIFRGYHARRKGEFVIESDSAADANRPFEHYRCDREFTELIAWLRSRGVASRAPLHTLRKEFGSQINAR
jgi:hypothetical protein